MKFTITGVVAMLCLSSLAASAHDVAGPGIDQRQARQQTRIQDGVASGALTGREAFRLERQQWAIGRMEWRARADGYVSAGERLRLNQLQDRASRNIRWQKHDAQTRG